MTYRRNVRLARSSGCASRAWRRLWPLGFYLGLAAAVTLPLPCQLSTHVPGLEGDAYVHLWIFDWLARALHSGRFNLYTTDLFYPNGVSLLNQNIAWFNAAIWMLFRLVLDAVPAYTLSVLLIPFFNGYALFLLAKDVSVEVSEGGSPVARAGNNQPRVNLAALLAGAVGTAWPAITSQLNHPNLVLVGFLALALRHLRRLIRHGRRRDVWWTGMFFGVMALVRVQVLLMSAFVVVPIALFELGARGQLGRAARWKQLLLSGLIALPLVALVVTPLALHHLTGGHLSDLATAGSDAASQDLAFYLLPNTRHPLWGAPVRHLASEVLGLDPPFYVAAFGYGAICLSGVALGYGGRKSRQGASPDWGTTRWGWCLAVLAALLLSLGPSPHVVGHTLTLQPYARLYERFLLPIVSEPRRFIVLLSIPLGVLAGVGVQRLKHRLPLGRCRLVAWGAIALVCLEFSVYPCPGRSVATPAWFERLRQEPGRFGILEVPMYRQQDEAYMLYQLTHHKRLVHGHVSRPPEEAYAFIDRVPLLAHLQHEVSNTPPAPPISVSQQMALLDRANIRYLVLHPLFLTPDQLAAWRAWLVVPPTYEDADVVVYATSTSAWAGLFADAPAVVSGLRVAQGAVSPVETIPGGWVIVQIHWFITEEAQGALNSGCLIWQGPDRHNTVAKCDLAICGDGERVETPGLVANSYLIQVPSSFDAGLYSLLASQGRAGEAAAAGAASVPTGVTLNVADPRRGLTPPSPDHSLDVVFEDQVAMVGYDFIPDTPEGACLDLYWHALRQPSASYKVFVHVVDSQLGQVVMQQDFIPLDWAYPTDEWRPGEYVRDHVVLDLASLSPGDYRLLVGMYDPETGERLSTVPAYPDDAVPLSLQNTSPDPD